mgnify:FL=1
MDLVKDFVQRIVGFLQDKMSRLRKMKRKNKWKLAGIVLAVALVVVAVGRLAAGRRGSRSASAETTVQSATAETGSISTTVEGTGTLQQGTAENITVPVGIKIEEVLVEAGDAVTAGQQLATVNTASVAAQLLQVEENLDDVKDEIADLSDDADEEGTTEYLEALVLKGQRKELRQAKKALKALLDTGAIEADSDGIIGEVYVSENTEVSSSSGSSGTSSASGTSGTSTVTATNTAVTAANTAVTANAANVQAASAAAMTLSSAGTIKATFLSSSGTAKSTGDTETTIIPFCSLSVTAPVTGAVPQNSITATDKYTGQINWDCNESVFQAGTAYTATIVLTAESGYSFSSSTAVTVSGASSFSQKVSSDGKTMTISAVFAATAADATGSSTQSGSSTETTAGTGNSSGATGSSSGGTTASSGNSGSSDTGGNSGTNGTSGSDSSSAESTTESKNSGASGNTDASNSTNGTGAAGGNGAGGQSGSGFSGSSAGGSAGSGSAAAGTSTASVSADSTDSSSSSGDEYSLYEAAAFSIVNEDEAVVSIQVDELDILSVKEGQTAAITMDAVEDQEFEGTITKVSATASGDSSSAKYPVEITLEKTDDMLYGMSASATIQVDEAENAVLIPVNALQEEGNSTFVYTENDGDGNLSGKVEVTTGLSDGSQVEITSGLEEGDTVYYLRTGTDSGGSEGTFPSMGGGKNGEMPSGGRGGSEGGGREAGGGSGGPGGNPGGFAQ